MVVSVVSVTEDMLESFDKVLALLVNNVDSVTEDKLEIKPLDNVTIFLVDDVICFMLKNERTHYFFSSCISCGYNAEAHYYTLN